MTARLLHLVGRLAWAIQLITAFHVVRAVIGLHSGWAEEVLRTDIGLALYFASLLGTLASLQEPGSQATGLPAWKAQAIVWGGILVGLAIIATVLFNTARSGIRLSDPLSLGALALGFGALSAVRGLMAQRPDLWKR